MVTPIASDLAAVARWRCLHEIAVVTYFVAQHGNDTAERYLLHDRVDSYKASLQYKKHCESLGYEPLTEDELNELQRQRDALVARFGKEYGGECGWAVHAMKKKRVTFRDLEEAAGLDHLRPFYKLASHNVHADPKGAFFRLGLTQEGPDILLAGPSNFGLADPGHCTAISLTQVTTTLLAKEPVLDGLVTCEILQQLQRDAGEAFIEAHRLSRGERCAIKTTGGTAGFAQA